MEVDHVVEDLIQQYLGYICATVRRRMGGDESAADVKQEALKELIAGAKSFRGESAMSTWIYSVVTHVCVDEIRRRARERRRSLRELLLVDQEPTAGDPAQIFESREFRDTVARVFQSLPGAQKRLLRWHYVEGRTYRDVAGELGCSLDAVKGRMRRARRMFKDRLAEVLES